MPLALVMNFKLVRPWCSC